MVFEGRDVSGTTFYFIVVLLYLDVSCIWKCKLYLEVSQAHWRLIALFIVFL